MLVALLGFNLSFFIMCANGDFLGCDSSLPLTRRNFLETALGGSAVLALAANSIFAAPGDAPAPKAQNVLTPDEALERLRKGNERYVSGVMNRHDFATEREALAGGQNPFAAILSCADSRIAPEYAFDTGRGDLFVVRLAGNFLNDDGLASLEYGVKFLGIPLLVVLGHEKCGAVDAALKVVKDGAALPGHLPGLVERIRPAVQTAIGKAGDPLENAIRENVLLNVAKLKGATPVVNEFVEGKKVRVVGGIYKLGDGRIDWIG
ncbi:MAG TPA: carbonic anhydrase [Chthoniobacteraceae bacterium]|jgi:carbonic anhydrase